MKITYKIVEGQLVRFQDDRPEESIPLNGKQLRTGERHLAALDALPYIEAQMTIKNELKRLFE